MPIQFPQRDLTNQYISTSYQDVVQRYASGSVIYFLDGYGFVIIGVPSASAGNLVLTQDQTASWAFNAVSASYASNVPDTASYALFAVSSSYSQTSSWELTSSFAEFADSAGAAAVAVSASYALFAELSDTASMSIVSEFSDTASLASQAISSSYALSASWAPGANAVSASWASQSFSSSYSVTSSYLVYPTSVINVINNTTTSLLSFNSNTYNSVFVNYILNDTVNYRAGSITVLCNTTDEAISEVSTTDLGDSSDIQFYTSRSGVNVDLVAINAGASIYSVKYHYDKM